jgi:hypothetical protein
MNTKTASHALVPSLLLAALLLTACRLPARQAERAAQVNRAQATQAALMVLTELARPTRTPTSHPPTQTPPQPSATPPAPGTPTTPALRVTARPGLALYEHPGLPGYLFQIDLAAWVADPENETGDLVHQQIADCRIAPAAGEALETPERFYWQDFGRFRWEIMDYGSNALAAPILGAGLEGSRGSLLALQGYGRTACREAQEQALAELMARSEAVGLAEFAPFRSPTPRPALEGFDCPDTPPARLRVGDEVSISADGLWLRSEPRVDTSTRVRQFLRYPPYRVWVVGGPLCGTYVYWQVELSELGEDGETLVGWLAEGDLEEYYLAPVR